MWRWLDNDRTLFLVTLGAAFIRFALPVIIGCLNDPEEKVNTLELFITGVCGVLWLGFFFRLEIVRWLTVAWFALAGVFLVHQYTSSGSWLVAILVAASCTWLISRTWKAAITYPQEYAVLQRELGVIADFDPVPSKNSFHITTEQLGEVVVTSGALSIGDPQNRSEVIVPNVPLGTFMIMGRIHRFSKGVSRVIEIAVVLDDGAAIDNSLPLGTIGVDSAKCIVADDSDLQNHWLEIGPERTGVIVAGIDKPLADDLRRRFNLKTRSRNLITWETVKPVSPALEQQIMEYLISRPKSASFPEMYFYIQTNNSFDRINRITQSWATLPIGKEPKPAMFVCETGSGDGTYQVLGQYSRGVLSKIVVNFEVSI